MSPLPGGLPDKSRISGKEFGAMGRVLWLVFDWVLAGVLSHPLLCKRPWNISTFVQQLWQVCGGISYYLEYQFFSIRLKKNFQSSFLILLLLPSTQSPLSFRSLFLL
mmetsp:Transcript_3790/g.10442  ORF Transcript_3790/g.10442 Transcript_3790/m.10442 type:complete len:107 (+) Transcript_3790:262-582(+)